MKFILNTAITPHLCALFNTNDVLLDIQKWTNFRRDGQEIYDFLEKNNIQNKALGFLGAVSGPGGFSSLRAGMGILNALSFFQNLPIHQVRADQWVSTFLGSNNFLLNSFSNNIFYVKNERLVCTTIDKAAKKFENTALFVGLLPPEKQKKIIKKIPQSFDNSEITLLNILKQQKPQKFGTPDYEFAAV